MKKAFTMIELLVVIAIIAILLGIMLGSFGGSSDAARTAKCQANLHALAVASASDSEYPLAGSCKTKREGNVQGWISWPSKAATSYTYPANDDQDMRDFSITNGSIWKAMSGSRDSYVCPCHRQLFRKSGYSVDPIWSYVMNAYFKWNDHERVKSVSGLSHDSLDRAERVLLFAELPFESFSGFDPADLTSASQKSDPILQYQGCTGGGDEIIGFNHRGKRQNFAHVCFADGHVEKIVLPNGGLSESAAKELTAWLCHPWDDAGNDIDISFDGSKYEKMTK